MTELPSGWVRARLEEVGSGENHALAIGPFGSSLKVADYRETGVPLVFVRNIRSENFDLVPTFVTAEKARELVAHRVVPGDVLITKMGDPPGDASIYPSGRLPAVLTADCIKVSTHRSVSARYVRFAVESPECARQIAEMTSGVAQQKVSLAKIRRLAIPVAPGPEQKRIVAAIEEAFSKLDAGEDGLRVARQRLKRMRDAVLADAVSGRLVPQDPNDTRATKLISEMGAEPAPDAALDVLPAGWAATRLGTVASWSSGGTPKASVAKYYGGGIPWAVIGDLTEGPVFTTAATLTQAGLDNSSAKVVRAGTVLLAMYGASIGRIGVAASEMATNQAIACAVPKDPALSASYLFWVLKSQRRAFVAQGKGAAQPNISQTLLKAWPVALPPPEEQLRIVEEVERQFSFIEACERALDAGLARSAALRRSVLKAAFQGTLVPQDPADERASVLLERIRSEREAGEPAPSRRRKAEAS